MTLADEVFALAMDASPIDATLVGLPGWDDRLDDLTVEAGQRVRARAADIVARADTEPDPVTRAVIVHQASALITTIDARLVEHTVAAGLCAPAARLLTLLPMTDATPRLPLIPTFLRQAADRLRHTDRRPLARHVRTAVAHLDGYLASPVAAWESADPDVVRGAFTSFRDVLHDEIAPLGRDDVKPGLCWLPDGEANYARLAAMFTTTAHTPAELHQLGLDLLAGLREEYAEIGSRVFGVRDVDEVFHRLRTDSGLRWRSAQEMLDAASTAMSRAAEAAPRWFKRMPSAPCRVELVPEADRGTAPLAYYVDPALDGSRPGTYFVNPVGVTSRDRTISDSVAFHEAVPGHHFQIALAQETDLPDIRRFAFIDAYLEGWALYTERLADEMGLYADDVARLGMLSQDAMRAARLVVDTGLHAFGWTRAQAISFLLENTVMSEVDSTAEVDRYIEWPGQALAYMVGRLEIQRLRAQAAATMGDRFDIREFHDVVLGGGPMPLAALADVVTAWSSPSPSASSST